MEGSVQQGNRDEDWSGPARRPRRACEHFRDALGAQRGRRCAGHGGPESGHQAVRPQGARHRRRHPEHLGQRNALERKPSSGRLGRRSPSSTTGGATTAATSRAELELVGALVGHAIDVHPPTMDYGDQANRWLNAATRDASTSPVSCGGRRATTTTSTSTSTPTTRAPTLRLMSSLGSTVPAISGGRREVMALVIVGGSFLLAGIALVIRQAGCDDPGVGRGVGRRRRAVLLQERGDEHDRCRRWPAHHHPGHRADRRARPVHRAEIGGDMETFGGVITAFLIAALPLGRDRHQGRRHRKEPARHSGGQRAEGRVEPARAGHRCHHRDRVRDQPDSPDSRSAYRRSRTGSPSSRMAS